MKNKFISRKKSSFCFSPVSPDEPYKKRRCNNYVPIIHCKVTDVNKYLCWCGETSKFWKESDQRGYNLDHDHKKHSDHNKYNQNRIYQSSYHFSFQWGEFFYLWSYFKESNIEFSCFFSRLYHGYFSIWETFWELFECCGKIFTRMNIFYHLCLYFFDRRILLFCMKYFNSLKNGKSSIDHCSQETIKGHFIFEFHFLSRHENTIKTF